MLSRKVFIYFYLVLFRFKWYALAQNGLCSIDSSFVSIKCDPFNQFVIVRESEFGCGGKKCWCILLDNQYHQYDGELTVELVHRFNYGNLYPVETLRSIVNITKVVSPLYNAFVTPYASPGGISQISSIKINNNDICRFRYGFEEPIYRNTPLPPSYDNSNPGRYYADCSTRTGYTENSMMYCPHYRPEFLIEKRYMQNGEPYYCIIINNDKNVLTQAHLLHIDYSGPYQQTYSPKGVYIGRSETGSQYHLGSPQTIIAVSEYRKQLPNLISITINNQPICNYFEQRAQPPFTPRTPPPFIPPTTIKPTSSPQKCGIKRPKNPLIAFGSNTTRGDWPWHAAVYLHKTIKERLLICGGTLINRKTIITAAHCVSENDRLLVIADRLIVELGQHNLDEVAADTQQLKVYNVVRHELYDADSFENDIAILVLANYVQITKYVNFVCLPQPHENFVNRLATTVGWGVDQNNNMQKDLKEVTLPVVTDSMCLDSNPAFFTEYLKPTNFCAGYRNESNVCRGDSGGGLVFKINGEWVLGGVTSLGVLSKTDDRSCDLKQYVIFTNVAKYLPWINQKSK